MSKIKVAFFCGNCGYESLKWLGKCPACNEWNTFIEEVVDKSASSKNAENRSLFSDEKRQVKVIALNDVDNNEIHRIFTKDPELNRSLGGGIVPGSIVLLAGEPGVGKSTLLLQDALALENITTLYISGEESEEQIKMRANRIGISNDQFYLLTETITQTIFNEIKKLKPGLVIIDSIQTLQSNFLDASPGSISQIRETAAEFQRFAKETGITHGRYCPAV